VNRLIPLALLALFTFSPCVLAEGDAKPPVPDVATSLGQTLVALVAVIALLFVFLWLMKRLSAPGRGAGLIKVISATAVGPRERIVLVSVGDKTILVGVTPGSLRTLHVFSADELPLPTAAAPALPASFAHRLREALKGQHNAG
jgi:flagellar protein FliO/FliZ